MAQMRWRIDATARPLSFAWVGAGLTTAATAMAARRNARWNAMVVLGNSERGLFFVVARTPSWRVAHELFVNGCSLSRDLDTGRKSPKRACRRPGRARPRGDAPGAARRGMLGAEHGHGHTLGAPRLKPLRPRAPRVRCVPGRGRAAAGRRCGRRKRPRASRGPPRDPRVEAGDLRRHRGGGGEARGLDYAALLATLHQGVSKGAAAGPRRKGRAELACI